jgi:hypothetical protein
MKIDLTKEQMRAIHDEDDLVIDNEIWDYECEEDNGENRDGRYRTYIYKRPSDNKYFKINLFYCRYGYDDYGYEDYMQDKTAYEVERKEVTTIEWVSVS